MFLTLLLSLLSTSQASLDCLQMTNANLACQSSCLPEGPNGTSAYSRLCDGVNDCSPAAIDEGEMANRLLNCKCTMKYSLSMRSRYFMIRV